MAGAVGFEGRPSFADRVVGESWAYVSRTQWVERWTMPIALWHSPQGFEAKDATGPDHHTLAFNVAGAAVEGKRGRRLGLSPAGASDVISLQPRFVATDYRALGEIRFAHLYLRDEFLRTAAAGLFGDKADRAGLLPDDMPFLADRQLRAMLDQYLVAGLGLSGHPSTLEMDSRAGLICLRFVRRHSTLSAPPGTRMMAMAPLRLARVKEFVDVHLAEDVGLAEIAAAAELSPCYFARASKRETGVSPHRYFMERRVERARDQLAGTDLPLAEVALACGFAGQSHFTTAFKRHTGMTPGAWRAAVRH